MSSAKQKYNNRVLKMNDEQTIRFMQLYEMEEVLWNTKLEKYRNRDARAEPAQRISEAMNIVGFGPELVITKFKNLRSSYCQELKKISTNEQMGAEPKNKYVPHVIWFSKMDSFLRPYVTKRDSQTNLVSPKQSVTSRLNESQSLNDENAAIDVVEVLQSEGSTNEQAITQEAVPDINKCNTYKKRSSLASSSEEFVKKRKVVNESALNNKILGSDIMVTSTLHNTFKPGRTFANDKGEDSLDHFAKYIVSLLRDLPQTRARLLQQQMVSMAINAITEYENTLVSQSIKSSGGYETSRNFECSSTRSSNSDGLEDYTITNI